MSAVSLLKAVVANATAPSCAPSLTARACGSSRRTRRFAATSCVTVSWVATASSKIVESNTRRRRPASTAVAATSKTRRGRCERLIRLRQYTSTVGWNPSSSNRSPQATFQAMSRRSALTPPGRSSPPTPAAP